MKITNNNKSELDDNTYNISVTNSLQDYNVNSRNASLSKQMLHKPQKYENKLEKIKDEMSKLKIELSKFPKNNNRQNTQP